MPDPDDLVPPPPQIRGDAARAVPVTVAQMDAARADLLAAHDPGQVTDAAVWRHAANVVLSTRRPVTDHINIGDTVEVRMPAGLRWRAEILAFVAPTADGTQVRLRCVSSPSGALRPGDTRTLPVHYVELNLVGDPDGMRESDKCDDVDVTGRVRPYHRHAATGEAHAHPGGGTAHTHQTREQWLATSGASEDPPELRAHTARLQHHADMEAVDAGDIVGTDSVTVFAVLRDIADNEPLSELTGYDCSLGAFCTQCGAQSEEVERSLSSKEPLPPVTHLVSCPWARTVEIVGRGQTTPAAPPVVCRCGHPESAHETQGWRACSYRDGCGCQLFADRAATDA